MKIEKPGTRRVVYYTEDRWRIFKEKRIEAYRLLKILKNYQPIIYGSIARGDVNKDSDIDIVLLNTTSYSIVRYVLESEGYKIFNLELVQATPKTTPRLCIYLDIEEKICISVPLSKLQKNEEEFYKYSGMLTYDDIVKNMYIRVPGVDKRLMLIIPTDFGHIEESIIGREYEVSKILNVDPSIIFEREKMLIKRSEKGRTGLYIRISINPEDSVEEVVRRILERRLRRVYQ